MAVRLENRTSSQMTDVFELNIFGFRAKSLGNRLKFGGLVRLLVDPGPHAFVLGFEQQPGHPAIAHIQGVDYDEGRYRNKAHVPTGDNERVPLDFARGLAFVALEEGKLPGGEIALERALELPISPVIDLSEYF